MSNVTSEDIQKWIKNRYEKKYHVLAEAVEHKRNYIICNDKELYYPDVLLKDCNGNIIYIIEVEVGGTTIRKSVVGATILADYCIGIRNQEVKPCLFFVVAVKDCDVLPTHSMGREYVT
jgi:hypothetical protein